MAGARMGYWVDLSEAAIKLEELPSGGAQSWIQAMPLGTYHHPRYGKIDIDLQRVQQFAANVNAGVRGIDLDIDYDHKILRTDAAGWVRKAEARGAEGLWLLVEWTKEAAEKIKNKAFRYFSPEFEDEWEHPKTRQRIKNVLAGGGLTNRPYLKDIQPINLSDLTTGGNMNRALMETVAKKLGVTYDDKTTDEQLTELITKASATDPAPQP